jgi:hypothetical protein
MNHFTQNFVSSAGADAARREPSVDEHLVQVLHSHDIDESVREWIEKGYVELGRSEFVGRGQEHVGPAARAQAAAIGASVVLFRPIVAKLRSIKRRGNGTIDIASVLADPPAHMSPRSYFVSQAAFLARVSN